MTERIVVAPHPDDEVLGCSSVLTSGPTTVVQVSHGVPPWIEGEAAREEVRACRIAESAAAWAVLGAEVTEVISLELDDLGVTEALDQLVGALMRIIKHRPGATVYVPAYQRGHPDHDAVFVAALLARHRLEAETEADVAEETSWIAYGLYGLDAVGDTRYGVLSVPYFGVVRAGCDTPGELVRKHEALRAFASQLRPESIVQFWLDDPQPEAFAPLPPADRPLPELAAYYIEGMDLASRGVALDDRTDNVLRAALPAPRSPLTNSRQ